MPGEPLEVRLDLEVEADALRDHRDRLEGVLVLAYGERLFDPEGRFHQFTNVYMSTLLTPTGMPVESFQFLPPSQALDSRYRTPLDLWERIPAGEIPAGRSFSRQVALKSVLPADIPEGYYRIHLMVFAEYRDGYRFPLHLAPFFTGEGWDFRELSYWFRLRQPNPIHDFYAVSHQDPYLPLVKVGRPSPPKMIWALLAGKFENGIHGIVAREDEHGFQLTSRSTRYPADFVSGPGVVRLEPDFPTVFAGNLQGLVDEASSYPQFFPYDLRFDSGELQVEVEHPDGRVVKLGSAPFRAATRLGATTRSDQFVYPFQEWGRYLVRMQGWVEDLHGNRLHGGGSYPLWIARPLTFSTRAKPGTPYLAGDQVSPVVSVHPPVPAEVEFKVTYFPWSEPARKTTFVRRDRANRFGQFQPREPREPMLLPDPGEYRIDLTADYRDPQGVLWHGNQTGAGLVAERRPELEAVGHSSMSIPGPQGEPISERARFSLPAETSIGGFLFNNFSNCTALPSPYFPGDVLFFPSTWGSSLCVEPALFMRSAPGSRVAETVRRDFPRGTLSVNSVGKGWDAVIGESQTGGFLNLMIYLQKITDEQNLPLLLRSARGYHPCCHPEENTVSSYSYFTAIRPGLIAYTQISDSTIFMNNWTVASNFGTQINAGPNGDMPGDVYRFYGGTVYRNREANLANYAAYASMAVVQFPGLYRSGVAAPLDLPLFEMNGREYYMFMGMDVGGVFERGGPMKLGGMIFPAVPARVDFRVEGPDRTSTRISGSADSLGVFRAEETLNLSAAGVYRVFVELQHQGRKGWLPGSSDGGFNFYVVDPDASPFLQVGLPPRLPVGSGDRVEIPLALADPGDSGEVVYSVFMPGILMDEGRIPIENGKASYRFRPAQFYRQFANYDIRDKNSGEAILPDTVMMVFFVETRDAQGTRRCDARILTLRDGVLWNL